ncbi:hypothetical protein Nepgr_022196 [Nepenthes gracilis]|uniref:Uncharacterized protein n=1 Tax=Nepenthes gracilis TaxID=150966 RepID=A0AAD3XXY6_NEPGR|nr:hypothetical protein Nepgr_022196 [Nepenthes gracilis]
MGTTYDQYIRTPNAVFSVRLLLFNESSSFSIPIFNHRNRTAIPPSSYPRGGLPSSTVVHSEHKIQFLRATVEFHAEGDATVSVVASRSVPESVRPIPTP